MKKITAIVMILCMLVCAATLSAAEKADVTGEWYASVAGVPLTLTLKEDGTFTEEQYQKGVIREGTWKLEDNTLSLVMGEITLEGECDGDVITLISNNVKYEFTRTPVKPIVIAEIKEDAAEEEFCGEWINKYIGFAGMILNNEAKDGKPELIIDKDGFRFVNNQGMTDLFGEESSPLVYENGKMYYLLDMGDLKFAIITEMLQDGMLKLTIDTGYSDSSTILYYVKAVTDE